MDKIQCGGSPQQQHMHNHEQQHNDGSVINGSIGLFDPPDDGGDDPEEAMFRNKIISVR